jgi:hypothetical protein
MVIISQGQIEHAFDTMRLFYEVVLIYRNKLPRDKLFYSFIYSLPPLSTFKVARARKTPTLFIHVPLCAR